MPSFSTHESQRLAALRATHIMDSGPSPEFDALIEHVRTLFDVPVCLVTLVEDERQWFKAKCGVDVDGTSREVAFCNYTILADDVFVVEDATKDPRFSRNPLVVGYPHIRFYAGAPLEISPGVALGSLCMISTEPRSLSPVQRAMLKQLATVAVGLIRAHGEAHQAAKRAPDTIAA